VHKILKRICLFIVCLGVVISVTGCNNDTNSNKGNLSNSQKNKPKINYTETIRVYNASEYMDKSTIEDFEREYAIKVEYSEFDSNESMYEDISRNPNAYDVLIPSDYMVDRLIKEGKLAKLDKNQITNISNIAPEYLNPSYDTNNDYTVPYMVGTLGILYNKKMVSEPVDSWNVLWDTKYRGEILIWDSMRDVIGVALKKLGYSMNSTNDSELAEAKSELLSLRSIMKAYAEEEARDTLIADEGALALVYSGEAKAAIDQNPNLDYVIPKEGSNVFVDGFVIMKNTKHLDAAQKFINFMCRPNIAVRNMTQTGYTSPITGAWSEFGTNKVMFPSEEELNRCEAFLYDNQATQKYSRIWSSVR